MPNGTKRKRVSNPYRGGRRPKTVRRKAPRKRVRRARRTVSRARRATRAIKQVVQNVLQCKDNVGVYTKTYTGDLASFNGAGVRTIACAMQRFGANLGSYTPFAMSFTPFSVKRVLDAASVLFNNKPKEINIDLPGNFDMNGLKVDVLYASYHLECLNATNVPMEVEVHEVTNKSNSQTNFTESFNEFLLGTRWVGGVPTYAAKDLDGVQWVVDSELDIGMVKSVASKYSIKTTKKVLYPGQKINYFVKTSECFDFSKYYVVDTVGVQPDLASYVKGQKQILLSYVPLLHLGTAEAPSNAFSGTNQGPLSGGEVNHGLVCRVKEVFKIIEPDKTLDEYQGESRVLLNDYSVCNGDNFFRNTGPAYTNQIVDCR